jgi:hypothetical protein
MEETVLMAADSLEPILTAEDRRVWDGWRRTFGMHTRTLAYRRAVDGARREARRVGDEQAYPLPDGLNVPTQLAKDQVLVLAENALTRGEGGLVDRRLVEFRVLGVLPF